MGCVPNKKQNSERIGRNSLVQDIGTLLPSSFEPNNKQLRTSQLRKSLTPSKIAQIDIEEQTKQNTYINSLPASQRALRASNVSVAPVPILKTPSPLSISNVSAQIVPPQNHQIPKPPNQIPQIPVQNLIQKPRLSTQMPYVQNRPPLNARQPSLTNYIPSRPVSPIMYPPNPSIFPYNQSPKQTIPGTRINTNFRNLSADRKDLGNFIK